MVNKVFLFGLDAAGKTTLVNQIQEKPDPGNTSPTLGFNLNQLILNDVEFIVWEGGGQVAYRSRWSRGVLDSNILLFVVDTSDLTRFDEAKAELQKVLNDIETRGVPLIIAFHKMDLDKAKENLPTAKGMFQPNLFDDRPIHQLATSIQMPETIDQLKNKLVEIIEQSRW
ncbi:MAG: ADP-ribosylation factor-like protein [Promethearchaeota archaeon]